MRFRSAAEPRRLLPVPIRLWLVCVEKPVAVRGEREFTWFTKRGWQLRFGSLLCAIASMNGHTIDRHAEGAPGGPFVAQVAPSRELSETAAYTLKVRIVGDEGSTLISELTVPLLLNADDVPYGVLATLQRLETGSGHRTSIEAFETAAAGSVPGGPPKSAIVDTRGSTENDDDTRPGNVPKLVLRSARYSVRPGERTRLSWISEDTAHCSASGAWRGARDSRGSEWSSRLFRDSLFTLSCDVGDVTLLSSLSVEVVHPLPLRWRQPRHNVDGSPLDDLAGYRVYLGSASRQYHRVLPVDDPESEQTVLELPVGDYYLAMTAVDSDGNESDHSNEVRRVIE